MMAHIDIYRRRLDSSWKITPRLDVPRCQALSMFSFGADCRSHRAWQGVGGDRHVQLQPSVA